ncbi:MAG TPA: glycosyltransferase [Solirubrobacteraceae bacterium]|nr:glycosyltransferase [Solirubrobacteraceae bacterium]
MTRPTVLFYCQHSLGLGHLVRSFALAEALAARFRVVLLNGGRVPRGMPLPAGVEVVSVPPLGMSVDGTLVSHDGRRSAERALELRRDQMLALHDEVRPDVVFVELFPFGRKKFAVELLPLLRAARAAGALTVCSVRDILVGSRPDQARHDERASTTANELFDAILVHADPAFARLEDSFRPATPLRTPVHYTGFVLPRSEASRAIAPRPEATERPRVLVSAGGGLYGGDLMRAAVDAHRLDLADAGIDLRLVCGPFLPDDEWRALRAAARGRRGLDVRRSVPDLRAELATAAASVSQCGYNTALDVLHAGVPALVVPFRAGQEDEQDRRADRLERMGALRMLEAERADGATLAAEVRALLEFRPAPVELSFDGARTTTLIVGNLLARAAAPARAGAPVLQAAAP